VDQLKVPLNTEIRVFLMGSEVAPPRQLADAIAQQRRTAPKGRTVVMIPVDAQLGRPYPDRRARHRQDVARAPQNRVIMNSHSPSVVYF
jgi:hypothetical protein